MIVSVCIPSVRDETIDSAIRSVLEQTCSDFELLIVGQGDDTGVRRVCETFAKNDPRVRYLHSPTRGLSAARNTALAASENEIVAFLDDDCVACADWLENLIAPMREDPDLGMIGGAVLAPRSERRFIPSSCPSLLPADIVYDPRVSQTPPEGFGWIGANFAVRRRVAEIVGMFDLYLGAGTFFPGGEDTDWMLRIESCGIKCRSTSKAVVEHTYGRRYGIKTGLRHSRNYACGNGALAAKLTLMGDERGEVWREQTRRITRDETSLRNLWRAPHKMLLAPIRWRTFEQAYHECLKGFEVDKAAQLLQPAPHAR